MSENDQSRIRLQTSLIYSSKDVLRKTIPSAVWPRIQWPGNSSQSGRLSFDDKYQYTFDPIRLASNSRHIFSSLQETNFHSVAFAAHSDYGLLKAFGSLAEGLSIGTPLVSFIPLVDREGGSKASYVMTPYFGQSLSVLAALEFLRPSRGPGNPPRKAVFLQQQVDTALPDQFISFKFDTENVLINPDQLETTVDYVDEERAHSLIVNCSLSYFSMLLPLLVETKSITNNSIVVFMHDYLEVQSWEGLEMLLRANASVYIFALCRNEWSSCAAAVASERTNVRGEREADTEERSSSIFQPDQLYNALFYDLLELVAERQRDAAKKTRYTVPVSCGNGSVSVFYEAENRGGFLRSLRRACFRGRLGGLAFSEEALKKCINSTALRVLALRLTNVLRDESGEVKSSWRIDGKWREREGFELAPGVKVYTKPPQDDDEETVNRRLKVIAAHSDALFSYVNSSGKWSGVDADLVQRIAKDAGFSGIEVTLWNDSTSRLRRALSSTSKWDMAVGAITSSAIYEGGTEFTRAYYTSDVVLASLSAQAVTDASTIYMWNFMNPFRWTVWLVILGMIAISTLVVKWLGLVKTFRDGLWLSFSTLFFMNENRTVIMRNFLGRIYVVMHLFVVLVLVSSYTANMISFLTTDTGSAERTGSLLTFRNRPVAGRRDTNELQRLWTSGLKNISVVDRDDDGSLLLLNGSLDGYVADSSSIERLTRLYCNLTVNRLLLHRRQYAFIMTKEFAMTYGESINEVITEYVQEGHVNQLVNDNLKEQGGQCSSSTPAVGEEPLKLSNVGGVFVIAGASGFLCLVWKLLILYLRKEQVTVKIHPANDISPV